MFYASNHMALNTKAKPLDNQEIIKIATVMEDNIYISKNLNNIVDRSKQMNKERSR